MFSCISPPRGGSVLSKQELFHRKGSVMLPHGKVQAVHEERVARLVGERERAERRRQDSNLGDGLVDLIEAMAEGLSTIGARLRGARRPRPAI